MVHHAAQNVLMCHQRVMVIQHPPTGYWTTCYLEQPHMRHHPTDLIRMATKSPGGVLGNGHQAYPSPPRTPKCTIYESGGSSQLLCVEIKSTPSIKPTSRPVYSNCNERDYSKFVSPSKRRVFAETPDEPFLNTQNLIRKEPVARKGSLSNSTCIIDIDTEEFSQACRRLKGFPMKSYSRLQGSYGYPSW